MELGNVHGFPTQHTRGQLSSFPYLNNHAYLECNGDMQPSSWFWYCCFACHSWCQHCFLLTVPDSPCPNTIFWILFFFLHHNCFTCSTLSIHPRACCCSCNIHTTRGVVFVSPGGWVGVAHLQPYLQLLDQEPLSHHHHYHHHKHCPGHPP